MLEQKNMKNNTRSENLQNAVKKLYDVFDEKYRPVKETPLTRKPRQQLTCLDLEDFAWSATGKGGVPESDFKYFLPRLMEFFFTDNFEFRKDEEYHPSDGFPVLLLRGVAKDTWGTWPEHEKNALRDFFCAAILEKTDFRYAYKIGTSLANISCLEEDLLLYLKTLEQNQKKLVQLWDNREYLDLAFGCNYFSDNKGFDEPNNDRNASAQILDWLELPAIQEKIKNFIEEKRKLKPF